MLWAQGHFQIFARFDWHLWLDSCPKPRLLQRFLRPCSRKESLRLGSLNPFSVTVGLPLFLKLLRKSLEHWELNGGCTPLGLPRWSICQYRRQQRHRFNPWVGKILWRRKWQPTPVSLLGKSHGQRSLRGYNPWGGKESGMRPQSSGKAKRVNQILKRN